MDSTPNKTLRSITMLFAILQSLEGTLTYQPNRLILESGQRLVVENFAKKAGTRLALRPARKRLFMKEPDSP